MYSARLLLVCFVFVVAARAQSLDELALKSAEPICTRSSYAGPPDAPEAGGFDRQPSFLDGYAQKSSPEAARSGQQKIAPSQQQPKRILGVMPNYRAVSAGEVPAPPSAKEAFLIATRNSFDYSALLFVGATSAMAEGANKHPQLGKGVAGFGRYYWRGFLDKTNGNYMVEFVMPTIFHQDPRYYALGHGGFFKRLGYSTSRVVIARNYEGKNVFNPSELLGAERRSSSR